MSTRKPKASKPKASKVAAAVEEVAPGSGSDGKTIEWRGHTFKLPGAPPRSLVFRLAEIQDSDTTIPLLKLLKQLLDSGEEGQYARLITEIDRAPDDDKAKEVMESAYELASEIMLTLQGVDAGESSASQDS